MPCYYCALAGGGRSYFAAGGFLNDELCSIAKRLLLLYLIFVVGGREGRCVFDIVSLLGCPKRERRI